GDRLVAAVLDPAIANLDGVRALPGVVEIRARLRIRRRGAGKLALVGLPPEEPPERRPHDRAPEDIGLRSATSRGQAQEAKRRVLRANTRQVEPDAHERRDE